MVTAAQSNHWVISEGSWSEIKVAVHYINRQKTKLIISTVDKCKHESVVV